MIPLTGTYPLVNKKVTREKKYIKNCGGLFFLVYTMDPKQIDSLEKTVNKYTPEDDMMDPILIRSDFDYVENLKFDTKFKKILEEVFEKEFTEMPEDDMDYKDMEYVLQLIKTKQWDAICPYVEKINETYFIEFVLSLILKAKEQMENGPSYYRHLNRNDFDSDLAYLEARVRAGMKAGYTFDECRDHWFADFEKALYEASDEAASTEATS